LGFPRPKVKPAGWSRRPYGLQRNLRGFEMKEILFLLFLLLGSAVFGGIIGGFIVLHILKSGEIDWEKIRYLLKNSLDYWNMGFGFGSVVIGSYILYREFRLYSKERQLSDFREKLTNMERSLKKREKELEKTWRLVEEQGKRIVEEKYWKEKRKLLEILEEEKKKEILRTIKEVAEKQEEVYRNVLEACEKEINSLRSRIHNQREHIKALERRIERLNNTINSIKGQFGARVIDIVKSAERNWILKGLKARKDLKLIKEKLRKM
jgi:hypothetical protein